MGFLIFLFYVPMQLFLKINNEVSPLVVILISVDGYGHDLVAVGLSNGLQWVQVLIEIAVFLQQTI